MYNMNDVPIYPVWFWHWKTKALQAELDMIAIDSGLQMWVIDKYLRDTGGRKGDFK